MTFFESVYQEIVKSLSGEFARGAIVGIVLNNSMGYIRRFFSSITYWVDRWTSNTLVVSNNNHGGECRFIEQKFSRENDYTSHWRYDMCLGYGVFYRWYQFRPLVISKYKVEQQSHHYDEIRLKTWFNPNLKKSLLEEKGKEVKSYISIDTKNQNVHIEITDNICMPTRQAQLLHDSMANIKKLWDGGKNIRGSYLLSSAPGQGKSQAIKNICVKLGINLKVLYIDSHINNNQLIEEVMGFEKTVLLIEDMDRYELFCKDCNEANSIKFYNKAAILNMLDGVTSPQQVILIGTTNHKEKLDPDLLRAGRFDYHMEFINPSEKEINDLWMREIEEVCPVEILKSLIDKPLCDTYKKLNEAIVIKGSEHLTKIEDKQVILQKKVTDGPITAREGRARRASV